MLALATIWKSIKVERLWFLTWDLYSSFNNNTHSAWRHEKVHPAGGHWQATSILCITFPWWNIWASWSYVPSRDWGMIWLCIIWRSIYYLIMRVPSCIAWRCTLIPLMIAVYIMTAENIAVCTISSSSYSRKRMASPPTSWVLRCLIYVSRILTVFIE